MFYILALIFGHTFDTYKHNLPLELPTFFAFNSHSFSFIIPSFLLKELLTSKFISHNGFNFSLSSTLCVMNDCCDTASDNSFIAQTCILSFLSVSNAFAVYSKMFVLFSSGGFSLTLFGLRKVIWWSPIFYISNSSYCFTGWF